MASSVVCIKVKGLNLITTGSASDAVRNTPEIGVAENLSRAPLETAIGSAVPAAITLKRPNNDLSGNSRTVNLAPKLDEENWLSALPASSSARVAITAAPIAFGKYLT